MSELMRTTVVRAPKPAAPDEVISLQTSSPFQSAMMGAAKGADPPAAWKGQSEQLVMASGSPPESTFQFEPLCEALLAELRETAPPPTVDWVRARLGNTLGDGGVIQYAEVVSDWIVALAVLRLNKPLSRRLARYRRGLRIMEVAAQLAPTEALLQKTLRAPLQLPKWLRLTPPSPPKQEPRPNTDMIALKRGLADLRGQIEAAAEFTDIIARDPGEVFATLPREEAARRGVRPGIYSTAAKRSALPTEVRTWLASLGIEGDLVGVHDVLEKTRRHSSSARKKYGVQFQKLKKLTYPVSKYLGLGITTTDSGDGWTIPITFPGSGGGGSADPATILPKTPLPLFNVGVGDLFTIQHRLKGYRGGEISRIDNVLKGETRTRDHRHLERTEETSTEEEESERVNESSLESTTRFELQTETSVLLKEQQNLKAGVGLSATLGPVKLNTSLDYTWDKAQEEAKKSVAKNSREVIEKALNRVTERTRSERVVKMTRETEEKNFFSFNNSEGDAHISGVYQWVDKVYDVQVWMHEDEYTMYDFVVPEPGAHLFAADAGPSLTDGPERPASFSLKIADVSAVTAREWAEKYGADNLDPYPEDIVVVGTSLAITNGVVASGDDGKHKEVTPMGLASKDLKVPPNYIGWLYRVAAHASVFRNKQELTILVGPIKRTLQSGNDFFSMEGDMGAISGLFPNPIGYQDTIPVALVGEEIVAAAATITVYCLPTEAAIDAWKLKTWSALRTAYERQMATFNDAVAAARLVRGDVPSNPANNRRLIEQELQRGCIALLTRQSFETFGALVGPPASGSVTTPADPTSIDFYKASVQMPFVRFFEDAFEWPLMSFYCYPYFWGSDQTAFRIQEDDPMLAEFLRAGAVRVIVPVKPGREADVESAVMGGTPWEVPPSEEALSSMSSDLVAASQRRADPTFGAKLDETQRWEVIVPTSLVKLRKDDLNPTFVEDLAKHTWTPDDP